MSPSPTARSGRFHAGRLTAISATIAAAFGLIAATTPPFSALTHTGAQAATGHNRDAVVVTSATSQLAADAVRQAGGEVTAYLPLGNAVAAVLPQGSVLGGDVVVVPDRTVSFASVTGATMSPTSTMRQTLGLPAVGSEGRGVTVALVDTGVADVPDLAGRLEHIDVTGASGGDGYGHGTFLAGLIAGSGAQSDGRFQGTAPSARILDVKVADANGTTSLSAVLRGLQALADRPDDRRPDVVNLSLSSASPLPYQVDPLNQALRALWYRGVTVVVAAGNSGPDDGTISTPGNDPTLLTVGGIDEAGSADRADDAVADWSSRGRTTQNVAKPDVVAPGAHVVGLRSVDSVIDRAHPGSRVAESYFLGSGTSMAAAVVSGAVADILAAGPALQPDQVKQLLQDTAYRSKDLKMKDGAGSGGVNLSTALEVATSGKASSLTTHRTSAAPGSPDGWLTLSDALARGDRDAAEQTWNALSPAARSWAARSWASLDPAARSWAARSWAARSWADTETDSREWAARSWAARSWAGEDWAARSWAGGDWLARSWAARSWAGDDWAARSWANDAWDARSWAALWR
jgi:serine protease AprX